MDPREIQNKLDEFSRDPKASMMRIPEKRDPQGKPRARAFTAFDAQEIRSRDFVLDKDALRRTFHTMIGGVIVSLEDVRPGRAPIEDIDRPENLVDRLEHVKPADMDAARLASASLAETPWSDDYWPIYLGMLGRRYADPSFPSSTDWEQNMEYVQENSVQEILSGGDEAAIDRLSPSEKYDLLVGDARGTLTAAMWNEGKAYYDRNGEVETWMGLCHGWAPAAYLLARPRRVVTVKAASGRQLRFYPSDVKALATLLWANAATSSRFIGSRSNDKDPKTDAAGRVLSPRVFDTNPGTWHMAVVNQIGVAKRSFIIDATYDYEVWNQPVVGYDYSYFNPQRMQYARDRADATVTRAQFTKDPFAKYRTSAYTSVVGVAMRARYVVETTPSHAETDAPSNDAVDSVDYYYDLELDADGRILGGEWYVNAHPDFLWTPPPKARAVTPADALATGGWSGATVIPVTWRRAAARMSARSLPLAKIVEALIRLANA